MIDGAGMPPVAYLRWRRMNNRLQWPVDVARCDWRRDRLSQFGSIMLATRLDKVGEAAVLRETSTVFAALIGWLVLKETVGPRRDGPDGVDCARRRDS